MIVGKTHQALTFKGKQFANCRFSGWRVRNSMHISGSLRIHHTFFRNPHSRSTGTFAGLHFVSVKCDWFDNDRFRAGTACRNCFSRFCLRHIKTAVRTIFSSAVRIAEGNVKTFFTSYRGSHFRAHRRENLIPESLQITSRIVFNETNGCFRFPWNFLQERKIVPACPHAGNDGL